MSVVSAQRAVLPLGLLGAAGFLSSAGARVIDPLLAVIASDFHVNVPAVSMLVAAFTLPYGLNQIVLGPVGDRYGKLRVMLAALLGYSIATAGCALASTLPALTLLRACAGASSAGLIPVCLAYIGDSVPYEQRQVTLSRFLTGVVIAQMMAGPVGGMFGEWVGWRGVFVLLSLSALTVALLLAFRLRGLPDRRHGGAAFNLACYRKLLGAGDARLLLLSTVAEGALLSGCFPFVAPYLNHSFGLSYFNVGLVLACFGIGAFGYTWGAAGLIRRLGEPGLMLLGAGLVAAGAFLAGIAPRWEVIVLVEIVLGLGYFMLHAVLQARATELLPNARATAVSAFVFMLFLGQSLGALGMGVLIARLGYRDAFLVDAAGIILLGLWLTALIRRPVRLITPAPSLE
jgi:predicted MFS family arabinose efflux permease